MTKTEILIVITAVVIFAYGVIHTFAAYRECEGGKIVRGVWGYECIR